MCPAGCRLYRRQKVPEREGETRGCDLTTGSKNRTIRNIRPPPPRKLIALSAGLLGLCCAGAVISLSQHLPNGATHAVPAGQVWHDFIAGGGTATSPPLPTMLLFAVAIAASAAPRWVGTLGTAAVAIISIAFILGISIEPITHQVLSTHPDPLKTPLIVLALLAASATALAAALELRQRLSVRHPRSAARH
jgi:hypothetical protein